MFYNVSRWHQSMASLEIFAIRSFIDSRHKTRRRPEMVRRVWPEARIGVLKAAAYSGEMSKMGQCSAGQ